MPLSPDTLTTEIIPNYARKLRDDVMMANPLWEYLFENMEEVDGGSTIKEQINYQLSPNADVFPGGVAPVNADFINSATEATFAPCYYWYSAMIPDTYKILARGEGEVINLLDSQFENALGSLTQKLGGDVWGTGAFRNGAPTLAGIRAVCTSGADPAGGAFGGISRVGMSGPFTAPVGNAAFWNAVVLTINGGAQTCWKGTVNPGVSTASSFQALMALVAACTVGTFRPSLLAGDLIAWTGLHNLVVQTVRQAPLQVEGGAGYPEISFAGIPCIQDDFAPSGTWAAINGLYKLRPWTNGFFVQLDPVRPFNAFATIYYGLLVMNLVHTRPNTMGIMTGVAS
jgi:hypothetical protein